jgi:hypothetical protein
MKYLIFATEADALNFQLRGNTHTGYPHEGTLNATSIEKKFDQNLWACGVATVYSWNHMRDYDMENEMLTDQERLELVGFSYLVANDWWPPE